MTMYIEDYVYILRRGLFLRGGLFLLIKILSLLILFKLMYLQFYLISNV
jgi:hypothetical protein